MPDAVPAEAATPPPPFKFGAPIPALLWESFEEVLSVNMRSLARDIASTLGQPPNLLLEALQSKSVRPYLFEETDDSKELDMRCDYMCQRPDAPAILQPCGQAVLWNSVPTATTSPRRCSEHCYARPLPRPTGLPKVHPLEKCEELDTKGQLFHTSDGTVKDAYGNSCGHYIAARRRLTLFRVEQMETATAATANK